jgi:hypothetical protein
VFVSDGLERSGKVRAKAASLGIVHLGIALEGRGCARPRALGGALAAAALVASCGLGACGAAHPDPARQDTGWLARDISSALNRHPGWSVSSVSCPRHAERARGVVIHCSATLRNGRIVRLRATQLDGHGTIHLVANEIFADNVERGIMASLPPGQSSARADCPNYVPVVIGTAFTCSLRDAGRYRRARVTIVDGDGGFRLHFL